MQEGKKQFLKIPELQPSFKEISELMRINADIVMKEITDHIDKELTRFKESCETIKKDLKEYD
jgi:hypothetical protein